MDSHSSFKLLNSSLLLLYKQGFFLKNTYFSPLDILNMNHVKMLFHGEMGVNPLKKSFLGNENPRKAFRQDRRYGDGLLTIIKPLHLKCKVALLYKTIKRK